MPREGWGFAKKDVTLKTSEVVEKKPQAFWEAAN